jgi:hypothetical protein
VAVSALIISIVAALFAGWAVRLAGRALRHDQAQTGTRQPIIARKGYRDIPFTQFDPDPKPEGWEQDQMRWVPIRLINRAHYEIEVEGPIYARLGWPCWPFRRSVVVARSTNRKIPRTGTTWYFVRLRKIKGWKLGWAHLRVRWDADQGRVRYKGWVKLRPGLPPEPPAAGAE